MTFTRKLGRSRIEVSALGMGCWAIGGPFWAGEPPNTGCSGQRLGFGTAKEHRLLNHQPLLCGRGLPAKAQSFRLVSPAPPLPLSQSVRRIP